MSNAEHIREENLELLALGALPSAGVFSQTKSGKVQVWSAEVPAKTEPKAFAVTIEPAGGVPQPTGPKVLLGAS